MSLDNIVAVLSSDSILKKFEAAILKASAAVLATTQADAAAGTLSDGDRLRRAFALRVICREGAEVTTTMAILVRRYTLATTPSFQLTGTAIDDATIESLVTDVVASTTTLGILNAAEASFRM